MRIFLYSEHCALAGQIVRDSSCVDRDDDDLADDPDFFEYGEGTRDDLIAKARKSLATRYDDRPGGAGDAFRRRCDRNVLAALGAATCNEHGRLTLPSGAVVTVDATGIDPADCRPEVVAEFDALPRVVLADGTVIA